jgi:hypothetical protein
MWKYKLFLNSRPTKVFAQPTFFNAPCSIKKKEITDALPKLFTLVPREDLVEII